MLIRPLFDKYQRHLLAFVNTQYGRDYLGIKTEGKIVKFTPDSWHIQIKPDTYVGYFQSKSPFLKPLRNALEGMAVIEQNYDQRFFNKLKQGHEFVLPQYLGLGYKSFLPQLYCLTKTNVTFVPDADPETTSVDGNVTNALAGDGDTFANIRGAATGTSASSTATRTYALRTIADDNISGNYINMVRGFFLFDTSSVVSNSIISSGSFAFYPDSTGDPTTADFSGAFDLVSSTPASNTDIITADFDQVGTTQFATVNLASITDDTTNTITLNAAGIAGVTKGGITKFGVRQSFDRTGTPPTWGANNIDDCYIRQADYGSNKPTLTLTYSFFNTNFHISV